MGSESRETRLKQKAEWEVKLQERLALLAEKGADETKIARDALVKKFKSKIRESQARLRVIDAIEKQTAELARMKAERLSSGKEETSEGKKAAKPASDVKPKKKKKKKTD